MTDIVRCRSCHGVYPLSTLIPLENPYLEHAPDDYFKAHDSAAKVLFGERLARQAAQLVGGPGRMLEVGCGRGELLRGASNCGWAVEGVELTESFAAVARSDYGIRVEVAPAESAKSLDERWDAILLAAVLEHVYQPALLLRRVAAALRPGGVLFIDVPNECSLYTYVGNLYCRLRGRDWVVNLSPTFTPFHVVGFCPRSLKHLLTQAGLGLVGMRLYRMSLPTHPGQSGWRAWAERTGTEAVLTAGHLIGMGAGITCWARRL